MSTTLALASDAGAVAGIGLLPRVARGEGGQFLVLDEFVPTGGGPLVFDREGGFAGVLGSLGDGPGEFRQPIRIASASGATVVVFDRLHGLQVLQVDGTESARIPDIPPSRAPEGFLMTSDSLLVIAGAARRPPEAPEYGLLAYHLPSGRLLGGFGPAEALVPGSRSGITSVAPSGGDAVWAVTHPHVVERFKIEGGSASHRAELPSDWLRHVNGLGFSQAADTGYVIHSVFEEHGPTGVAAGPRGLDGDDGGPPGSVLWVLSLPRDATVPDPFAAPAPGAAILPGQLSIRSLIQHRRTVISALCLASGEVLAHRVVEGLGLQFLPDGNLLTLHEGDGFEPEIRVHVFRLR